MPALSLPHRLNVRLPLESTQCGVMHQQLPIYTHDVEEPNVRVTDGNTLFLGQLILCEQAVEVVRELLADP